MTYADAWRREKGGSGRLALALGLAVELAWCLYAAGSRLRTPAAEDVAYNLAYLIAAALSVALLVWGGLYVGVLRRARPGLGRRHVVVLLVFAAVVQLAVLGVLSAVFAGQKAQVRTAAHEVEVAVAALRAAPTAQIDVRPKATGDAGELERLIKTTFAELQQDRLDYLAALTKAGVPERLNPDSLVHDASLRTLRASLARGEAIAATYRERYRDRKVEARAAIVRSALSMMAKNMVLDAFDRAAAHADHGEALWEVEGAYLAEMDAAAADLQHAKGRWTVHGEEVVFAQPADLQAYNRRRANLHALAERKSALFDDTFRQALAEAARLKSAAE